MMYCIVQVQKDGSVEPVTLIDHPIQWVGRGKWAFQPIIANRVDADNIVAKLNKTTKNDPEYRVQPVTIVLQ